ncbi:MAG: bifunctional diaminohydroxyphosphoribosylaminopyrimidine deaminase/5-amino-6-(5-phosphoribosylamino)uracil reductase RibD [Deltaproteobacteria bacterium]|jgi:diaminohydroxyphosphoribosylaminopyrimidine deaminase/5-amino-6-(5-phosphoribosylamino)uracil reductase|nr:bifunctional diaminohydroxyphosphoribosylaminopyrimidine deaminase/5-amino-6-(5-phosphoribosylamino)uracil reductase RibD [Deltaproteobacteria bacterium]
MLQAQHPFYRLMLEAVRLSRQGSQGFGRTAPNPCVGALLVRDDQVLAGGFHAAAGQDHAEVAALKDAAAKGVNPAECTLVVTLEPCNHYGKTPPCTKAILEAGIRRVVIGASDPNPQAAGGADFLRSRSVQVESGVAERECLDNIADFLTWQNTVRPYVILKLAATLDGRIATRSGHSKWISGPQALARVHELRSNAQAVLIGGNTFYQDNPRLTCRAGENPLAPATCGQSDKIGANQSNNKPQPLAIVLSSRLPDPKQNFHLLRERPEQVIFWTSTALSEGREAEALRRMGVRIWGLEHKSDGLLDLGAGLERLRCECGVYYLLCEGGGRLGLSLLENQLVDEFRLHLSPKIIGDNEARPLFDGRNSGLTGESGSLPGLSGLPALDEAPGLRFTNAEICGDDLLLQLRRSL